MQTKYQVRNCNTGIIATCDTLKDAIIESFRYDGYGFDFFRTKDGIMTISYSDRNIAGRNWEPNEKDCNLEFCSHKENDETAIQELCKELLSKGFCHSRLGDNLYIEKLTYEGDRITHLNDISIEEEAKNQGFELEEFLQIYTEE